MTTQAEHPAIEPGSDISSHQIQELFRLFHLKEAPALVGPDHKSIPIPEPIFRILLQVIGYLREGKGVSVIPVMEELTTQHAANILGVSRPFLIGLVNSGKIEHHMVGTHRRIYLKDLLAYKEARDRERWAALDDLAKKAIAEGDYDIVYAGDDGE